MSNIVNTKAVTMIPEKKAVGTEIAKVANGTGMLMAGLIGIWGLVCLVSSIAVGGLGEVVKGYITAVIGG